MGAKGAPLHAGAYDAQDVVVSVVEARKSSLPPPPSCDGERLLGRRYGIVREKRFETDPRDLV